MALHAPSAHDPSTWLAHSTTKGLHQQLSTAEALVCCHGLVGDLLALGNLFCAEPIHILLEAAAQQVGRSGQNLWA